MKEIVKKILVILTLVMLAINSQLLTIISEAVEDVNGIIEESKINRSLQYSVRKIC